jgi:2-polyprenyl-3-methyl-5-hydroxy-6-metoxy-1,4-benzoquinol methylase
MKNDYENYYREIEARHPWFVARSDLFLSLMPSNKNSSILDFGCGSGGFLKRLKNSGYKDLSGVEVSEIKTNSASDCFLITKTIQKRKYDVILMMDVLEHIEDDSAILREIKSHLKPDGILLLSVPAYQFLWSNHDNLNMHYRRYNRNSLQKVIKEAKFKTQFMTSWNSTFFLIIAASRLIFRCANKELSLNNNFFSRLIYIILTFESFLMKKTGLPFGLSIISSCSHD